MRPARRYDKPSPSRQVVPPLPKWEALNSLCRKLTTSFKASFALQGRWIRALARRRWDRLVIRREQFPVASVPTTFLLLFLRLKKEDTINDPPVALRRQLPLLKGAFKFGLFVRKQSIFFNCMAGARRVKRIVRWTIRSQSGEQFIIATGNCSRRNLSG